MIRTTTKQVTLDLSDGNYQVGDLDFRETGGEGHGGLERCSDRVTVPIHFHILGREDLPLPSFEDPAVVIHSTPVRLEETCEAILAQLRA
jgi:hypothetical protein